MTTFPRKQLLVLSPLLVVVVIIIFVSDSKWLEISKLKYRMKYERKALSKEDQQNVQNWLQRRQDAQMSATAKKVLLFAYMRGGSTILSQAFAQNPDVFFWYEPLDQFHSSIMGSHYHFPISSSLFLPSYTLSVLYGFGIYHFRPIHQWESDLVAEYIHNMYNCLLDELPTEALSHFKTYWGTSFRPLEECMKGNNVNELVSADCKLSIHHCFGNVQNSLKNNCTAYIHHYNKKQGLTWTDLPIAGSQTMDKRSPLGERFEKHATCLKGFKRSLKPCLDTIMSACHSKPIHASKILKLTMDSVDEVLERVPDLSLIYFVRDPRGIATSRKGTGITFSESEGKMVPEANIICQKMRNDLTLFRRLQTRYPGAMTLVRYEDLVLDLQGTLTKMYGHFGEEVPQEVYNTLYDMMHADEEKAKDEKMFSMYRSNANHSLDKWLWKNTQDDIDGMTKHCSDVLEALGYPYDATLGQEYMPHIFH